MHGFITLDNTRSAGFTLTELAIVMVIMALLIGGLMLPLSAQQEIRNNAETTRQLDEIREALLGFAITRGYLPCPAKSTSDGNEDRNPSTKKCTGGKRYGLLPWVTLGITPSDSWGHLFLYSVTPGFSHGAPTEQFKMTSSPDITIKTRDSAGNLKNLSNSEDIPVVVLSTGKNGYWSWTLGQTTQNPDSSSANDDEDTNASSTADGKTFVSHTPTSPDYVTGEFDDLVSWISPNILFNRMVAAGRLP
jgi:prepilin-type N-terminal cleavage/methylation domain-containing protein